MASDGPPPSETTSLLPKGPSKKKSDRSLNSQEDVDIERGSVLSGSLLSDRMAKSEQLLAFAPVGERLPYNDYTTIDHLHDLTKDSFRQRTLHGKRGIKNRLALMADQMSGWVAAAVTGVITACVAFVVDIAVVTISDWKTGYCAKNYLAGKEMCCTDKSLHNMAYSRLNPWYKGRSIDSSIQQEAGATCKEWIYWREDYAQAFAIYVSMALAFGIISCSVTLLTKRNLPAAAAGKGEYGSFTSNEDSNSSSNAGITDSPAGGKPKKSSGKVMYMAAGSGIPEIKTVLSGFVIPNFLDLKVLVIKAVGSIFAVSTGMCLGKEGPFVHISTCVAYLVAKLFPKYRENGRKMREMLSAGCAAGLSVAFGAPIGGVLFSYEEISTYFPRKVLWRAFLCSLLAAITLRQLNPTGTGKLVLFETDYGTSYTPSHYLIFILLGVAGGIFGGIFCKCNFLWSRRFRSISVIKNNPVLEAALVTLATALLQYPHPVTREPGDVIIKNLLVDCRSKASADAWVCVHESAGASGTYVGWLMYGTLVKLVLTIITFGVKVPSGIIIPSLDAGAFFGRLVGQIAASDISPGIFAMVGAVAFLAGVSRMTISLAVIMLELTGELEYVVPYMVGILVAKWVADIMEPEGVYDLAQTVLGHPFLDGEQALKIAQLSGARVEELIPPKATMQEITVEVPAGDFCVSRKDLTDRLELLKRRGLMDAGLVLVRDGLLQGYLSQAELEGGLSRIEEMEETGHSEEGALPTMVRVLGDAVETEDAFDFSPFVDKTPLAVAAGSPIEFAVEMFSKLGLRYLCVLEDGTGRLRGVIIKKRLLDWLHKRKGD